VRDDYRGILADGLSGPEATERLLREWRDVLNDEDERPLFWLALAATQWDCGRLEPRVRAKALETIRNGSSLGRWSEGGDEGLLRRHKAVLEKLRRQLLSRQRPMKQFRRPRASSGSWVAGEVLAYRLRSRQLVLLHLVNPGRGSIAGQAPIFAVLDWIGTTPPEPTVIKQLPLRPNRIGTNPYEFMTVGPLVKQMADRLTSLSVRRKPHRKATGGFEAFLWKDLDRNLKEQCGWK
jgi:hypothetical protein